MTRLLLCLLPLLLAGCAAIDDAVRERAQDEEAKYNAVVRAKVQALQAEVPQQTEVPDALRPQWGVLGDWAGNFYLEASFNQQGKSGASFRWINPGYLLEKLEYRHDRCEVTGRILFWYDPMTRSIQTDRRPYFGEKGEFELMFGDDRAITLRDRESNEITNSKIVPLEKGYVLEESGFFSGRRRATLSSEAGVREEIATFHRMRELESRARSARWAGIGGALTAGVTQGVAQANTEQRERQLEQNRQRSAFMAAQAESAAREQQARQRTTTQGPADSGTIQSPSAKPSVATAPQSTSRLVSTSGKSTQGNPSPAPKEKQAAAHTTPGKSAGQASAKRSLGPARAWCMRKKNGEFSCNGPLQNGGWGATLKGALAMVDCTNGRGFTPTIGGGGELFQCERDLRPGEKVMPASDPWR